jgi:hypothetical protein
VAGSGRLNKGEDIMIKDVIKYDVTEAAIAEMKKQFMPLVINNIDDKESFDAVHNARMVVKNHRVSIEKKRKELKADALEYGRKVDSEAKRITALLEPIETHLQTEEDKVINEKKRIQEEKEAAELLRVTEIRKMIACIGNHGTPEYNETSEALEQRIKLVTAMEIDDKYMEFMEEAKQKKASVLLRLYEALAERKEYEQEQAQQKAEKERLKKLQDEIDRKDNIKKKIQAINESFYITSSDSIEIVKGYKDIVDKFIIDDSYMEFQDEAQEAKDKAYKIIENRVAELEEKATVAKERETIAKEKAELAKQKRQGKIDRLETIGLLYDEITANFNFFKLNWAESDLMELSDDEFNKEIRDIINEVEAEKARIKKEKEEREQQEKAEKEKAEKINTRKEVLKTIGITVDEFHGHTNLISDIDGFTYVKDPPITWDDLIIMSDTDFHKFIIDIKSVMEFFIFEKEKKAKEAKEKAEAEAKAREAELKPDKELLSGYAKDVEDIIDDLKLKLFLKTEDAKHILEMFQTSLCSVIETFKGQIDKL